MVDRDDWARLLAGAPSERAALPQRICDLCVSLLGVTGAGISLSTATGNRGVVCATDDVAARIEDLQVMLGEGPCVDAVGTGGPVLVPDLDRPDDVAVGRWPAFMEGAGAAGVRAVFAFPLRIGAIGLGAIDLSRTSPGDLDAEQLAGALIAADAAALALLDLDPAGDGFAEDYAARSTYHLQVHQATGMVQAQLDVTTDAAFATLRARAFASGRQLVDVATDVVERRLRFTTEDR
ncbi:MAG TPA: GAF and ANTAR domain-containing protein [Frankiaceae bacterium]|nr:GAF and ANTAR domain-containing protein [Frankiaceae bacterium]